MRKKTKILLGLSLIIATLIVLGIISVYNYIKGDDIIIPINDTCLDKCSGNNLLKDGVYKNNQCQYTIQSCQYGCEDNKCKSSQPSQLCLGKTCPNKCSGNNLMINGACSESDGLCHYTTQTCQYGCSNNKCNAQTIDCSKNICSGSVLSYNGKSSTSGSCSYNTLTCFFGCSNGECVKPAAIVNSFCGDTYCQSGESTSCPQDCLYNNKCGDGICDNCKYHPTTGCTYDASTGRGEESHDNCPYDCYNEASDSYTSGNRKIYLPYHTYDQIKYEMQLLMVQYPGMIESEVIGKTIMGKDIYLFKIGNPNGGRFMWDGRVHGMEDCGTESGLAFIKWVLSDASQEAKDVREKNYLLFIPVVNADSTRRQNMRRTNTDGTYVMFGTDLNRNAVYQWSSQTYNVNPLEPVQYRGESAGSEPETKALNYAMAKYLTKDGYSIYMNTHCGMHLLNYQQTTATNTRAKANIERIAAATGSNTISLYGSGYASNSVGAVKADGATYSGGNGWIHETAYHKELPLTVEGYLNKFFASDFPIYLGLAQAVQK